MLKTCLVIWSIQFAAASYVENEPILLQYRSNEKLNLQLKDVPHIPEEIRRDVYRCGGILEKTKRTFLSALYYLGFGTKLEECGVSKFHSEPPPTPVIGRDSSPGIVWYKIGDTMKIDLLIQQIPDQGTCSLYITKGANLISKSIFHGLHNQTIEARFELTEQDDNVTLEVSLRGPGNCNKMKTPLHRLKKTTDEPSTRCLTKACTVTLYWNNWRNVNTTSSTMPPRVTGRIGGSGSPRIPRPQRLRPLVTKPDLNTTGRLAITCTAQGRPFDVLAWYQVKGTKVICLVKNTTVAQRDRVSELYVTLNKTLDESDRGTSIFCASGDFSYGVFSENVTLSFENVQTCNLVGPLSPVKILAISASVLAVALIVLGVAVWRRRHGKSEPEGEEEENEIYYASAGVTYAILDMETPVSNTKPIKKEDLPPYTKIMGAYKARN